MKMAKILQVEKLLQPCVPCPADLDSGTVRENGDAAVLGVWFDLGKPVDIEDI